MWHRCRESGSGFDEENRMTSAVEPRAASLSGRGTRLLVRAVFGATQLVRRPPRPPGAVYEHAYGAHPAERLEHIEPRAGAPLRA